MLYDNEAAVLEGDCVAGYWHPRHPLHDHVETSTLCRNIGELQADDERVSEGSGLVSPNSGKVYCEVLA
ncbi:hypothetical protein A0H81_07151 [Grifola frondosa]|uniref:Uncharacterized protein n=1 Tax=Grifola frondosa TaxID=5627 RepID=A0A1C7M952_GRIFR|nr:hypothetical protein A0H81_07151 [Grifola frondosa]